MMKQANTVIIFSDQHSIHAAGCYGSKNAYTPNIDKLAARGTLFENAYTPNPICVPARASFATGEYSSAHGYWDNCHAFDGEVESWGKRLKDSGVNVTTIGKNHYKDDSEHTFPGQRIALNVTDGLGDPLTAIRIIENGLSNASINTIKNAGIGEADYVKYDRRIAQDAAEYLRKEAANSDKPWCLYVGFTTPHNPYNTPKEYFEHFELFSQFEVSKEWHDDSELHPAIRKFRKRSGLQEGALTDEEIQKAIAAYYAHAAFTDDMVGIVLDALRETGLEDTTRVIYMDDHGDLAGEHGLFFKSNMYEGAVHIPLIVAGPDIPEGNVVHSPASIIDIYPTLLDFYNIPPNKREEQLPGISLIENIHGKVSYDRPIFSEYYSVGYSHSVFMLRKGDFKLVYYVGYDQVQLFDLKNDPEENHDLGMNPDYADKIRELQKELYQIADPETLDKESLRDQEIMIKERGGLEKILCERKNGIVFFSPVPAGII